LGGCRNREEAFSPIDLAAIFDLNHEHLALSIENIVDNPIVADSDPIKIGFAMHLDRARRARCAGQRIDMRFESLLHKSRQLAELAVGGRSESNRIRHGSDSDFALHLLPWDGTLLLSLLQGAPRVPEIALVLIINHAGGIRVRQRFAGTALWKQ